MRNRFDSQLEQLNTELIKMGALCEEAISAAAKAFLDNDRSLVDKVHRADHEIDQAEHDIETLCIKLLLRQQPVATDLRVISSALKMISDMERIGDQAADIAEITRFLQQKRFPYRRYGPRHHQYGHRQRRVFRQERSGSGASGDD